MEFDQEEFEPEEALREDQGVESAEYDTDEAETGTQEGAEWESVVDEPLEATDEELEADEADYERVWTRRSARLKTNTRTMTSLE